MPANLRSVAYYCAVTTMVISVGMEGSVMVDVITAVV